ncbi:MAG: ATP-binding cassette domain-containing protein [Geovibrio sp.]|nr:ATP-binding cassette domain-containing protein [Geovibrio sp.]
MDEIFQISNRIQVMRDGKSVAILDTAKTTTDEVIKFMVGRDIGEMYPINQRAIGEKILEVKNLSAGKVSDITFDIKKGEIVGLFGLMGAGRTDIAKAIYGAIKKKIGRDFGKRKYRCHKFSRRCVKV